MTNSMQTETIIPDSLIAGDHPTIEIPVTIAVSTATTIERGALLEADENNKYKPYVNGNTVVIAANKSILTANSSCPAIAIVHGELNSLSISGAEVTAALTQKLQGLGLYLKEVK